MGRFALALVFVFALACGNQGEDGHQHGHGGGHGDVAAHGVVESVAGDRSSITIRHDDIPDVMPAMTMPFVVEDPRLVEDVEAGAEIDFTIQVTDDGRYVFTGVR